MRIYSSDGALVSRSSALLDSDWPRRESRWKILKRDDTVFLLFFEAKMENAQKQASKQRKRIPGLVPIKDKRKRKIPELKETID